MLTKISRYTSWCIIYTIYNRNKWHSETYEEKKKRLCCYSYLVDQLCATSSIHTENRTISSIYKVSNTVVWIITVLSFV